MKKIDVQSINEFVWYNSNVKISNRSVYNVNLFKCGLWYVSDLYKEGHLVKLTGGWKEVLTGMTS